MNVKGDPLRILFVDPTHAYQTLANDCFPLAASPTVPYGR